jgi:regulatory protein
MGTNSTAKRMLEIAQALCSRQEKCLYDIRSKLRQWGAPPDMIPSIEKDLLADRYIDETRYSLSFAREKARFNVWGPKKIEMALRAKQISNENIQLALAEVQQFISNDTLVDLLQRKTKTLKACDKYELRNKLIRYGLSKGFGYDDIQKALSSLNMEESIE